MESLFRREAVKFSTLTNLSHLTTATKNHLRNVYTCLSLSMLSAAAGAYLNMKQMVIMGNSFLLCLLLLGGVFWLHSIPHTKKNLNKRLAILCGIGFLLGAQATPLLNMAMILNPSIIVSAFMTTCSIFVCFTMSALLARRRTYLYLGGILSSVCMAMMIGSLFGIRSMGMFKFYMYAGVAIAVAFILYDTQIIIEKHMMGDDDYILHSVTLFIDFIQLFRNLLMILAVNDAEDKKRKRRS